MSSSPTRKFYSVRRAFAAAASRFATEDASFGFQLQKRLADSIQANGKKQKIMGRGREGKEGI